MYNTTSANAKGIVPPVEIVRVKKVLDVILYQDIEESPNRQRCWKPSTLSKFIADANLSHNRFEQIVSILHFNDNNLQKPFGDPTYDPGVKVKPIVDHLQM